RRLSLQRPSAIFGGMLFAFSGFNLLHVHHLNVVAVVAQMPWLLATADVVLTGPDRRTRTAGYGGLALVLASELWLGFPQCVWWTLLALVSFILIRAAATSRWDRLLSVSAAVLTGGLLGAIQVVPMLDAAARSVRPLLPRDFSLTFSLHPWNVLQL